MPPASDRQSPAWVVAAIRSAATYAFLALYILACGPPGLLLVLLFRWQALLFVLGHGGIRGALALSGIRYTVSGRHHLVGDRAAVYCANHNSNLDPPILFEALHPRLRILYKAELSRLPLLGRAMKLAGFVAVDRSDRDGARRSIDAGAAALAAGRSFLIFPEGTRSRTGELLPFKKGGFVMALQAGVPIVPVAIAGGWRAMRRGSALVWPAVIRVSVGTPIETSGLTYADRDALIAQVRQRIEEMMHDGVEGP